MIIKHLKNSLLLLTFALLTSCGGGGGDDSGGGDNGGDKILPPEAATLVSPLKNEECNQGNIISDTESSVAFEWNKATNANSYTIVIKNLNTNVIVEKTITTNKTSLNLLRGVPYSWHVISKAAKTTTTASSTTWNLFNAGAGVENYAPFPASVISPTLGSVTASPVTLEWLGSDLDNDIVSYNVYLGTTNPPTQLHKEATTATTESNITLTANTVYYWLVITKDNAGNTSNSPVFEFRTDL